MDQRHGDRAGEQRRAERQVAAPGDESECARCERSDRQCDERSFGCDRPERSAQHDGELDVTEAHRGGRDEMHHHERTGQCESAEHERRPGDAADDGGFDDGAACTDRGGAGDQAVGETMDDGVHAHRGHEGNQCDRRRPRQVADQERSDEQRCDSSRGESVRWR